MPQRADNQQQRQQLLTIADRGTAEELFVSEKQLNRSKKGEFSFTRNFCKYFIDDLLKN